jgi:hypothetical protein
VPPEAVTDADPSLTPFPEAAVADAVALTAADGWVIIAVLVTVQLFASVAVTV